MANKSFEQQIAVFGESGSGKTVLLSSLYGTLQEATHKEDAFFRFQAVDAAMHNMLMQTYLGMRDDNAAPLPSAFKSTQHVFTIKPLSEPLKPKNGSKNLRLTWHDYPGEWFERSALGESEAEDRAKTFKNLLGADVAIFLIDAARLLEYPGEEERYLKSVFSNFQNSLLEVKDRVIEEGAQLEQFPRIWMIALSKADLLPEMTVESFQELVILKAGAEINALRQVIADFVGHDDALSVGEDYVLLSSAQFTPGHIDLQNQKGIDIILPLATRVSGSLCVRL